MAPRPFAMPSPLLTATSEATAPAELPWWCSPVGIVLGFLLPVLVVIAAIGDSDSRAIFIRGVRFLGPQHLALGGAMLVMSAIGAWFGGQIRWTQPQAASRQTETSEHPWDRSAMVLGLLAVLAFLVWFRDYWLNPGLLWQLVNGDLKPDRASIALTPGLTSLANLTPVFFALYAVRLTQAASSPPPRALHGLAIALAMLTLFRVYAWSERLALIEAAAPVFIVLGSLLGKARGRVGSAARSLGPYLALPVVVAYFGLTEYARAWSDGAYRQTLSFWEFAVGRFATYYYTSLNNGAGLLETTAWPTFHMEYVLAWVHSLPGGIGAGFSNAVGMGSSALDNVLLTYEDIEFNSPSGLFAVVADLGLAGAMFYAFVTSVLAGWTYRAYRDGHLLGVLMYPLFFVSYMEIFRYPYLGQPRAFIWTMGAILACGVARTARAAAPQQAHPNRY